MAFAVFAALSLIRGAAWLEAPLPGGLPLGNGLVASGLCALAGAACLLSLPRSTLRAASLVSLVAAMLWLPVSVVLAGNPQLNFSGGRGLVWLVLSVTVLAGACSTLLWAMGAWARRRFRPMA
ncbi:MULTISPECIES: hypothetical protein [unclassified Luteimonas]|uniref:hypothetical protein n=1 Tax=unclassified Luteimonas TaxID=2629088 RepID=UPI0018F08209|nr:MULTISPECIES: hypothetical protein [unclassified Luteimonas]MBJ6979736.1 hypothetical protein [Luteimonas sp. MC1895]MBJ6985573.1 hypothetical protein [Luteimonas sp. MC1750]QQO05945.1 hypothetical protein JGR68_00310 [Luteimonas sp. MC1750]